MAIGCAVAGLTSKLLLSTLSLLHRFVEVGGGGHDFGWGSKETLDRLPDLLSPHRVDAPDRLQILDLAELLDGLDACSKEGIVTSRRQEQPLDDRAGGGG